MTVADGKMDIVASVGKAVDTGGIGVGCVVSGPRVLGEDFAERGNLRAGQACSRQSGGQARIDLDLKQDLCMGADKAVGRIGMRIDTRQIGLDIIDRRSVHQISAGNDEDEAVAAVRHNAVQPDARQADRIRPKRGTRGEDAHADVAAQARGTYSGLPVIRFFASRRMTVFGKAPDEPDMGEAVKAAEGFGNAIRRFKNNLRLQRRRQAALSRQAELRRKIIPDAGDDFHGRLPPLKVAAGFHLDSRIERRQLGNQRIGTRRQQTDIHEPDTRLVNIQVAEPAFAIGDPGNAVDIRDLDRGFLVFRCKQGSLLIVNRTFDRGKRQVAHTKNGQQIDKHPEPEPETLLDANQGDINGETH